MTVYHMLTKMSRDLTKYPSKPLDKKSAVWYNKSMDSSTTVTETKVSRSKLPLHEQHELLESMVDRDAREKVEAGEYYIASHGEVEGYPVLRWAIGPSRGRLAPGTGRTPGSGADDRLAEINKRTGYRRSKPFREMMNRYAGTDNESHMLDPEMRGSAAWLMERAFDLIEGGWIRKNVNVTCEHCGSVSNVSVEMYKKGDSRAWQSLIEQLAGKATETKEIDVNIRNIMEQLNAGIDVREIEVIDVTPDDIARRRAMVEGALDG